MIKRLTYIAFSGILLVSLTGCLEAHNPTKVPKDSLANISIDKQGRIAVRDANGKVLKPKKIDKNNPIHTKRILSVENYSIIRSENDCIVNICKDGACVKRDINPGGPCPW